jgi:hypothetical protein
MLFSTLLNRRQRQGRRVARRQSRPRLQLEWLEPRNLLSIVNINTDTDLSAPHNETTIAVNPTNPRNLIGSANDYQAVFNSSGGLVSATVYSRAHVTFDGGQTWNNYVVPFNTGLYGVTGDPAVAFDADGTAYLSTLGSTTFGTAADVLVAHSANGGQSWTVPVRVAAGSGASGSAQVNNDKEYIAAWGHGNAIVTWTVFTYDNSGHYVESPIFASITHNGGNTWTSPVEIDNNLYNDQASIPVVAADGNIYVAFTSFEQFGDNGHNQYMVVKVDPTTAKVLKDPVRVADIVDSIEDYPVNVDKRRTYQDSELRTWSAGNITADPTNALHLAVVWSDMRNSTLPAPTDPYQAKTNSDIVMSQSFDGGNTWSAPTALAIPNDQFMPWGAYNARGQLQIGFFDRSYDSANHKYGYTLASETTPGSLKFTFQQVTTALSDPTQGQTWFSNTVNSNFPNATRFMGDYSNIAISPKGVAAFWTDMRLQSTVTSFPGTTQDAFFALVDPPPPPAGAVNQPATAGAAVVPFTTGPSSPGSIGQAELSLFQATGLFAISEPASSSGLTESDGPISTRGQTSEISKTSVALPAGSSVQENQRFRASPLLPRSAHASSDNFVPDFADNLVSELIAENIALTLVR